MTPEIYRTLAGRLSLDVYEVYVAKLIDRFDADLVKLYIGAGGDDTPTSEARDALRDGLYAARHQAVALLGSLQKMRDPKLRFELGRIVVTDGVAAIRDDAAQRARDLAFRSHGHGHWGDLNGQDLHLNEVRLREGGRLVSHYTRWLQDGDVVIVTEADRSMTTVMLAEES